MASFIQLKYAPMGINWQQRENFLTPRSIKSWDSLPVVAVEAKLLGSFETRLDKVLENSQQRIHPVCLENELEDHFHI